MLKTITFIGGCIIMGITNAAEIVTLDKDTGKYLTSKCQIINLENNGLAEAQKTIAILKSTLKPLLPAAGLAAPQIGISQRIFLFSWDRTEQHQIGVINPSFTPVNDERELGWEGCFSIMLGDGPYQLANIPRYKKIKVTYINEQGQSVTQILEGFSAKVFQHEYDHIEGIANVHRKDAEIKTFGSKEAISTFMKEVKAKDKVNYIAPYSTQ